MYIYIYMPSTQKNKKTQKSGPTVHLQGFEPCRAVSLTAGALGPSIVSAEYELLLLLLLPSITHWQKNKNLKNQVTSPTGIRTLPGAKKAKKIQKSGPTGIRTLVAGFKVQSANHYTIRPTAM